MRRIELTLFSHHLPLHYNIYHHRPVYVMFLWYHRTMSSVLDYRRKPFCILPFLPIFNNKLFENESTFLTGKDDKLTRIHFFCSSVIRMSLFFNRPFAKTAIASPEMSSCSCCRHCFVIPLISSTVFFCSCNYI